MRKFFALLAVALCGCGLSYAQTNIFNCSGFISTNGTCGVSFIGYGPYEFAVVGTNNGSSPAILGTAVNLLPAGGGHTALLMDYTVAKVNVQAFTSTFTFVPNGQYISFSLSNSSPGLPAGASAEGGFYQGECGTTCSTYTGGPFKTIALMFDSYNPLTQAAGSGGFTYSSWQLYSKESLQAPFLPVNSQSGNYTYYPTNKISTSPVPLNSPAGTPETTTGDTYSVTIGYDGWTVSACLYDVTAANGSCSSSTSGTGTYATQSWSGVLIPSIVGGNTAQVGILESSGELPATNLLVKSWSYTVNTPTASPNFTAWNAGSTYDIGTTSVASPIYSVAPGTYASPQSVAITTSTYPHSYICYETSVGTPALYPWPDQAGGCVNGTLYTGPVSISSTTTLYAVAGSNIVAFGPANTSPAGAAPMSTLVAGTYTIGGTATASTPTFSPAAGTYSSGQSVTISDATSGATIYYTTDGSTPSTSSTAYTDPIAVSSTETLKAIAVATGDTNSAVASATYTITSSSLPGAATPTFSLAAGTYTSPQSVSISDATSDATIYYTTNGTTPTTSSTPYTGSITVGSTETLEAIAVAMGDTNSAVASASYTIISSLPPAATPAFLPAAGAYTSTQSVTITDATSGATIYYTTDGSTPTTSSAAYNGPIMVSLTETLQAIAVAAGDSNSTVASAAYTITASLPSVSTPTFSPAAGTYNAPQSVTISDSNAGATIYYTTNGTTPTALSTAYTGPIAVNSTETLQAVAVDSGDSAVASAAYTIAAPPTAAPNFVLGASTSSLSVNSGGQGTVMLTVTPENGFDSPVVLACSGVPAWATCSFEQTTVTPANGAVATQLTISANAQSSASWSGSQSILPFTALAMTVGFFGWRRQRAWHQWLLLAVAYAGLGLLFGCGGTTSGTSTPPTAATVTVTAISGKLQGTAAITVTVQ